MHTDRHTQRKPLPSFTISSLTAKSLTEGLLNDDVLKTGEGWVSYAEIKELETDGNFLRSAYMKRTLWKAFPDPEPRGRSDGSTTESAGR